MFGFLMAIALAAQPVAEVRCPCSCGCARRDGRECDCGIGDPCKCRDYGCQCYRGQSCTCDAYAAAYERAMREGKRLIVGVGQEPPAMDGIRIRVAEFPGIERGYVVGTPGADGMERRDYPAVTYAVPMMRSAPAVCVSG